MLSPFVVTQLVTSAAVFHLNPARLRLGFSYGNRSDPRTGLTTVAKSCLDRQFDFLCFKSFHIDWGIER
ncbi:hypothetical protein BN2476_960128 [Paraburkholderia piptadeniae]|uniref:Uncharacterized protein n=1 Tax=Paraburkholderia piptadeniae TaxID=1701573 RepID=A0A1N7SU22_9BURK|nr:hypothetical protein BN2476_960128 [Paraburkholderia piptadeniae]